VNVNTKVKSPCGAADLLAAIFGADRDSVRARFGLPLIRPPITECPVCGSAINKDGTCHRNHDILLACDQCGKLFSGKEKKVIWKSNYSSQLAPSGQQHQFCSRYCLGCWCGTHYGFKAHPENQRKKKSKHNMERLEMAVEKALKMKRLLELQLTLSELQLTLLGRKTK